MQELNSTFEEQEIDLMIEELEEREEMKNSCMFQFNFG